MSFGIWSRTVRDGEGNVIDDAEVEVREVQDPDNAEASPITLATIYDDFGGTTEKSNPFTVDGDGRAEFYADGDFYHVIVSRDGVDAVYLNQQLGTAQARDLVVGADGNVPAWDANGNLVDSGQAAADIGSGGGASALDDLSDVTITSPADDDLLAYDSGSSEFINQSKSEAGFGVAATKGVTGADANAVTGTAGTSGNLGEWNADGDLVDTGIASSAVFTQSSDVDHDQTTGFVANEHVDHSTVNVDSGDGLTGGGNLTATRTLSLDPAGATAATIAGDDDVLFGDTSNGGAVRRATAQEIADLGGGGAIVFEPPVSSEPSTTESYDATVDAIAAGDSIFGGGAQTGDGRIVFAPSNADEVHIFDPATDTVSVGPAHGQGGSAFRGAVLMTDGRVLLVPFTATNIGLFDPSDDSYTDGPAHGESGDAFAGGVELGDGRVALAPWDSLNVGLFDPSGDTYSSGPTHGEGTTSAFFGAVLADDGRAILVPYRSANVGSFDPSGDTYTAEAAHGENDFAFNEGVLVSDGRVVMAPYNSANVGVFDPSTDTYSSGPTHGQGSIAFGGTSLDGEGRAIFAPADASVVGIFDPSDDSFSSFSAGTNSDSFRGAVSSPIDSRVVFVPDNSDNVGIYSPDTTDAYAIDFGEDVPDGYVAQGWFQPNETTTPTLRNTGGEPSTAIPIVNRDGSDLAIGALDGAHRVYRDGASPDVWYLLDPVRDIGIDVEDDGTVVLNDVPNVNFGRGLSATADGDGSATVDSETSASLLAGHIDGLELANNGTDADHDIDIATGVCSMRDGSGNRKLFDLTSVLTKQIDANWAEGDAGGGFPSGLTLAADTHYNVFVIGKDDGSVDAGFDTDASGSNLLADASTYSWFRRIGSVFTEGSSNVRAFLQRGDRFEFEQPPEDVNNTSVSDGTTLTAALSAPPNQLATVTFIVNVNSSNRLRGWIYDADIPDRTGQASEFFRFQNGTADDKQLSSRSSSTVSSVSEVKYRVTVDGGGSESVGSVVISAIGWLDSRGRNA